MNYEQRRKKLKAVLQMIENKATRELVKLKKV